MLILILRFLNFICSFFFWFCIQRHRWHLVLDDRNIFSTYPIWKALMMQLFFNLNLITNTIQTFNSWAFRIRSSFFLIMVCNVCYFAISVSVLFGFLFYWFDSLFSATKDISYSIWLKGIGSTNHQRINSV